MSKKPDFSTLYAGTTLPGAGENFREPARQKMATYDESGIIYEFKEMPIDSLTPYKDNDRVYLIDDGEIEKIAEKIKTGGFDDPILVSAHDDETSVILSGHQRILALKKLGRKKAPCMVVRNLTPEQEHDKWHSSNTLQRKMSPYQRYLIAKDWTEYYESLAEKPAGRARDNVANLCGLPSATYYFLMQLGKFEGFIVELLKDEDFPYRTLLSVTNNMTAEQLKNFESVLESYVNSKEKQAADSDEIEASTTLTADELKSCADAVLSNTTTPSSHTKVATTSSLKTLREDSKPLVKYLKQKADRGERGIEWNRPDQFQKAIEALAIETYDLTKRDDMETNAETFAAITLLEKSIKQFKTMFDI